MPFRDQFSSKEEYNVFFREYRRKHLKKMRKYNREYNRRWRKEHGYHNERNSRLRYPEKEVARKLVSAAIRNGKIERKPCRVCKAKNSQAHHDDYSKPLKVIWLCPAHHMARHKRDLSKKNDAKILKLRTKRLEKKRKKIIQEMNKRNKIIAKQLHERHRNYKKLIDAINRRNNLIVIMRRNMTLQAIGNKFGLTRERIRQIVNKKICTSKPTAGY